MTTSGRGDEPAGGPFAAPAYVRAIAPYPPGRPIEDLARETGLTRISFLASNENPWGPSPRAVTAIAEAAGRVHRYPDGGGFHLREALARRFAVDPEEVVLGNGSGEIVDLLCKAFVTDGETVVVSDRAFVQYRLSAQSVNARLVEVPARGGVRDDLPAMAEAARQGAGQGAGQGARQPARIVFLAHPNNPTGTFPPRADFAAYFARVGDDVLTVVDMAYREYVEDPDYADGLAYLAAGRNVAVLGTFSKVHGLAGLRIGYALAPAGIVDAVERVRAPYNTSLVAQAAALAALGDDEHVALSRRRNAAERAFLEGELARRGVAFVPSAANFLLVEPGPPCGELFARLLERGVVVRPLAGYGLPRGLRVTVGTHEENEHFLEALDGLGLGG